jgi:hypothetical protein
MSYDYRGDPILGPALAYWIGKCGIRSMPRKRDIDPTEIPPKLLPNLQIIEVIDGGAQFRYRLIGTALVEAKGKDYTGQYPEETLSGDRLRFVLNIYRTVCKLKSPLFSRNRYRTNRNIDLFANRVYMPLSDDGMYVDYIFAALQFESGVTLDGGIWGEGKFDPSEQYIEPIESNTTIAA